MVASKLISIDPHDFPNLVQPAKLPALRFIAFEFKTIPSLSTKINELMKT